MADNDNIDVAGLDLVYEPRSGSVFHSQGGQLALLLCNPKDDQHIGHLVAASAALLHAAERANDWFSMTNADYWSKYGLPAPDGKSLARELADAISAARGVLPPSTVPDSDDIQGSLF